MTTEAPAPPGNTTKLSTLEALRGRYADDFVGFCELLQVPSYLLDGPQFVPFVLTPIQHAYCASRTPRDVILKPRKVGITWLELARDLWFFLTKPGVNVRVLCSPSTSHGMLTELCDRVDICLESLRGHGFMIDFSARRPSKLELPNGSTLTLAEASTKDRGGTIRRLHAIEPAFWEDALTALRGMLPAEPVPGDGTEVVFESSANRNDPGFFRGLCIAARSPGSVYTFHFFPWMMSPEYQVALAPDEIVTPEQQSDPARRIREESLVVAGVTPEQLKWYRSQVDERGQATVDQEYHTDPDTVLAVGPNKLESAPPGRPHDIFLGERQQWGGEMGPGPYSFPVRDLRKLIAGIPVTVSHLLMGPHTAASFLGHPDVVPYLHLVESDYDVACGTVNGAFLVRGLARIEVRAMEEGIVLAFSFMKFEEVGRISGAVR